MDRSPARFVSVVVPCRNEARFIGDCLASIIDGEWDVSRLEILVVDGMSTDGTRDIVSRLAERHPAVRLLSNPSGRIPAALNIGISCAGGDIVVRMDAHAIYDAGYISGCVRALEETGADCVGGYMTTRPANDTPLARLITTVWTSPFGIGNAPSKTTAAGKSPRDVPSVFSGACGRAVFERVGTYDEELVGSEDLDFHRRLRRAGGRIVLVSSVHSTYVLKTTELGPFLRKTYHNGYWSVFPVAVVPGYGLWSRHLIPAVFVTAILASVALAAVDSSRVSILLLILAAYAATGLTFFAGVRPRSLAPARLAIAFLFHSAYGLGSLAAAARVIALGLSGQLHYTRAKRS